MAALKWHPALDFGDLHIIRMQLPIISRASPILLLYRSFDCASEVATKGTIHGAARMSRYSWQMTSSLLQTIE